MERRLLYPGCSSLAPFAEQSGERPAVIRDLDQRGTARGTAPKGAFSEASDWPVGVRGPSSGEGRWPKGFLGGVCGAGIVGKCSRSQTGKGLHRSCLSDILEAVPGAERMSRLEGRCPERLHDSQTPVVGTRISLENRRVGRCAGTKLAQNRLVWGHAGPQG